MKLLAVALLVAACGGHPGKNQVIARHGRDTDFKANVTRATFDGKLQVYGLLDERTSKVNVPPKDSP